MENWMRGLDKNPFGYTFKTASSSSSSSSFFFVYIQACSLFYWLNYFCGSLKLLISTERYRLTINCLLLISLYSYFTFFISLQQIYFQKS